MRDPWKRGLRVAGYAMMALAIAHCGDNNNNNDNGGGHTPGTKTSTPASKPHGTVTSTVTEVTPTGGIPTGPTATSTPTGSGRNCPAAISVVGNAARALLHSGWTGRPHHAQTIHRG